MTEKINDYNGRDYRTVWKHPRALFEDKFESKIIRTLLPKSLGWFVDIGAGYGRLYPLFKAQGRKVVLVDYALNLLEMAAEKYSHDRDIFFVAANAYHLPFKDNIFAGGVSVRVFHHMNIPSEFMKETGRVIQNDGAMVMEYANKRNLFRIFRRGMKSFRKDHEEYGPLHFGTHPLYFDKIANDCGFRIMRTYGTGYFPIFIQKRIVFLTPFFLLAEIFFDATFGRLGLAPLNFSYIKKVGEEIPPPIDMDFKNILQCPACGGTLDLNLQAVIRCTMCNRAYRRHGKIFDLRYKPDAKE